MMTRFCTDVKRKTAWIFLAALLLLPFLTPALVFPAERDGSVLFFSFEDLQKELSRPTLPQSLLHFAWRSQQQQPESMTPLERSYLWGNGLGVDGYARPGAHRPLWGY